MSDEIIDMEYMSMLAREKRLKMFIFDEEGITEIKEL